MNAIKKFFNQYQSLSVVAKATLWLMVCSILQRAFSLITVPVFSRLMSVEQYGQFSAYSSWTGLFSVLTTMKLDGAVFNKGMSQYKAERDSYTSTMQTVTLAAALVLCLLYVFFSSFFSRMFELPVLIGALMTVELSVSPAIDFWTMRNRYEYRIRPIIANTAVMLLLNAVLGVWMVLFAEEKGYARILSCIIVNTGFGLYRFWSNIREALKKKQPVFQPKHALFALKFNLPLLLHYISQYILDKSDRLMVQKLVSVTAAGIYSIAYNIGLLMRIVTTSLNNAVIPWLYGCLEKKEYRTVGAKLETLFGVISMCSVGLSCVSPELMRIIAPPAYHEGVYVIPPVVLSLTFSYMYTTFANIEFYFNCNRFSMYISGAAAVLNVLLNFFGIRMFGYIAAAYTTLICYILFAVGHYLYMNRHVKKETGGISLFCAKKLILISALTLCAGLLVILVYDYFLIRYAIIGMILLTGYFNRKKLREIIKR